MDTILVTGSEGNIGTYLVKSLRAMYPTVRIIRISRRNIEVELNENDVFVVGDLLDDDFVSELFGRYTIDYLIHSASFPYNFSYFRTRAHDIVDDDTSMTKNILSHASSLKKIIYLSSALVYESCIIYPFSEKITDNCPPPLSPYGIAKKKCEDMILDFCAVHDNITYTIWRLHNVVSPLEDHITPGGHVFVDFYRKLIVEKNPELEIYGNGYQVRCFTWVEDDTDAIARYLMDSSTDGQIFNLGSDDPRSLFELKDIFISIGKERGILPTDYNPSVVGGGDFHGVDTENRISSIEKVRDMLGWSPETDFATCFHKFVETKQSYEDR